MHFAVSVDGFVAGVGHDMGFMGNTTVRDGLHREFIETPRGDPRGAYRLRQRHRCFRPYGGAWKGPIFVLTHHPEDARPAEDITLLSCPVDEAVRIALETAQGKR